MKKMLLLAAGVVTLALSACASAPASQTQVLANVKTQVVKAGKFNTRLIYWY